jgi:arylamine N-acetyltransferase
VRSGNPAPLPGSTAEEFFESWLRFGTGGTCWSGANAFYSLLHSLGFPAFRGVGTMLVAPDLPPNHGTVVVQIENEMYLVDCSILHGEPLKLSIGEETSIAHPAWGVRCSQRNGRFHIHWRPLNRPDGFECRLERSGVTLQEYQNFYGNTRVWSPFNYELTIRKNCGNNVIGVALGHSVVLKGNVGFERTPLTAAERRRILIEDLAINESIVQILPADAPTPPPPWSRTAREH